MHYNINSNERKKMIVKLFTFSLLLSLSFSNPNDDFTTLLSFKISADSSSSLPWSSSSYPCSWLGVTCHPTTHRVTKLILNNFNLTGSIQILTRLTQLRHLSLQNNFLSIIAPSFSSWHNLKHLYLSHNEFSGEFPDGVSNLHRLLRLDLSYNNFSGQIPMTELTQLPHLVTLLLEFNSFTGTLNSSGLSVSPLTQFNVSENVLSGKIPDYLVSFPVSSFSGNSRLCGKPLALDCYDRTAHSKPVAGDDENGKNRVLGMKKNARNSVGMMIISVDVVVVILTLFSVTWCCYRCRDKKMKVKEWYNDKYVFSGHPNPKEIVDDEEMVCFEGCKGFDKVDELLMASAEMLGKGSVGTTYKVEIEGGDVVVKRVRLSSRAKKREIDEYLRGNIGVLRNPNVLSLRAFSCSKDELLLVYDFLPNGSLFTLLHGNRGPGRTPLDWNTRLKVALGCAQGLTFLHSRKLVHGNLTSSNIIIDHLLNPCISDISLNLLLQIPSSFNNPYRAPELVQALHTSTTHNNQSIKTYTKKCDVYSFGVILLEILTGKTAWIEGDGDLVNWVEGIMKQDNWIWEVFDFEMLRYKEMEGEMKALLEVALLCLVSSPKQRLEMIVVKKMIDNVRVRDMASGEFQESISYGTSLASGSSSFSESV